MDHPASSKSSEPAWTPILSKAAGAVTKLCRESNFAAPFFLLGITLLAYFPALRAGYVWDDEAVYANRIVRTNTGLIDIWLHPLANYQEQHYWPIVYTTFWIEDKLWGTNPLGYHLNNILLHAANSILLLLILRRLRIRAAWLAAAIFALHPVHVESVAWIVERKDVLSAFFYFLAFLAYLRFDSDKSIRFYTLSLALFVAAMLCKSIVITLPLTIALWTWWKSDRLKPADLLPIAPFLIAAIPLAMFDLHWVYQRVSYHSGLNPLERGLVAGSVPSFYAYKVFWPAALMPQYPAWEISAASIRPYVFPLILCAALFIRIRWKSSKNLVACLLFFVITLLPISGVMDYGFMRYSLVADRFQYLASAGLIILVSGLAIKARDFLSKILFSGGSFATAGLLLLLGLLTWRQSSKYLDNESLFVSNLEKNPNAWLAYDEVGNSFAARRNFELATKYYGKTLEIKPDCSEALNNLGAARYQQGQLAEAEKCFSESIKAEPTSPDAYSNLGTVLMDQGRVSDAAALYTRAIELNPEQADALNNLGSIRMKEGKLADAMDYFSRAVLVNPTHADALANLNKVKLSADRARAGELNAAAAILLQDGKIDQAIDKLIEALTVYPDFAKVWNNLGVARLRQGKPAEAVECFQRALKISPGYSSAGENLRLATSMQDEESTRAREISNAK